MKLIEKIREMESMATPAPWGFGEKSGEIMGGTEDQMPVWIGQLNLLDARLACRLRTLVPEILAMWETGYQVGKAFDALSLSFDAYGNPTDASEPLQDEMHQRFCAFAEAMNALNKRAGEVIP